MTTRSHPLTLLLLLAGLSTAPVGSLEQAVEDGLVSASIPHAGRTRSFAERAGVVHRPDAPGPEHTAIPSCALPELGPSPSYWYCAQLYSTWNPRWRPLPGYRANAPPRRA